MDTWTTIAVWNGDVGTHGLDISDVAVINQLLIERSQIVLFIPL